MSTPLKRILILSTLLVLTLNVSAQTSFYDAVNNVNRVLLRKDIKQAIKEAENDSANDLSSMLWRLSLYQRATHYEKVRSTVHEILAVADTANSFYTLSNHLRPALKDPHFKDTQTLQSYLRHDYDGDVYRKLVDLCLKKGQNCDITKFDEWLERKAEESPENVSHGRFLFDEKSRWTWVARRIAWRELFGLDNELILSSFAEYVRSDPTDLDAALRYLSFFRSIQNKEWLMETFASEQAYDYYELGETFLGQPQQWQMPENERMQTYQFAARLLQKSLSLPFNEKDKGLMWSRRFMYTSIPPVIKNHEKQLRFWTKIDLAEALKNMGRPHDAQPIVEELMNLDISDIVSSKPSHLAGAVQAASGARVVESKILLDEATSRTSYEYWMERVAYYRGRNETEHIFDAYLQSFSAVPFDLSKKESRENRLHYIRDFAYFVNGKYGYYGNSSNKANFNDEEKQKLQLWGEAEAFLRNEFEKTRSNIRFSYELVGIIYQNKFEKLSLEILTNNPELLVNAAQADLITDMGNVLYAYFELDTISQEKKDLIADQILKIAEKKDVKVAWAICEALKSVGGQTNLAPRVVPILEKNHKIAVSRSAKSKRTDENSYEGLANKYLEILFSAHLLANDWKSAEGLLMKDFSLIHSFRFDSLIMNAVKNGAFDDAIRYWKLKSNMDRRNLENLGSLKRFPAVVVSLRQFYKQMKIDEPYSPVPDLALEILN